MPSTVSGSGGPPNPGGSGFAFLKHVIIPYTDETVGKR